MRGNSPAEDDASGCFEEGTITEVRETSNGWSVLYGDSIGCGVRDVGVTPKIGDHLRVYGSLGYAFHGQALNGTLLWYRTIAEAETDRLQQIEETNAGYRERFEADRERLDSDYESLPPTLRLRIDGMRARNEDFRWRFESYEMFVSTQAALLAAWADVGDLAESVARIEGFNDSHYSDQYAMVDGWSDAHSGNTYSAAVHLARELLTNPERAGLASAALSPLVGDL